MENKMLITGSSRGIGAAIARLAKVKGYEVLLHGRTQSDQLMELAKELDSKYVIFDISNENEVKKALSDITQINFLVNSAGLNISKAFDDLKDSDWRSVYDVNIFGLVNVIRYTIPIMKRSQSIGKIINIASIKGLYASVGRVAYASSKAAVINLTTGLAKELAPRILVNAVAPGFTNTEMTKNTWSDRIKKQVNNILLKRMADPKEIAEVVLFLSSDMNQYITGQTINVDGGFSIKND
jgi:3-oxoacyl-[acyl-carrier protein] reductase|tara:strand:+ start:214 stop:930 length:717 start_codon:yes stop_codon:yes gene_type:complete